MPALTGMVLAEKLRGLRPNLPVVLCTGLADLVGPDDAATLGIRGVVLKPATIVELGKAVRRALDSSLGDRTPELTSGREPFSSSTSPGATGIRDPGTDAQHPNR